MKENSLDKNILRVIYYLHSQAVLCKGTVNIQKSSKLFYILNSKIHPEIREYLKNKIKINISKRLSAVRVYNIIKIVSLYRFYGKDTV